MFVEIDGVIVNTDHVVKITWTSKSGKWSDREYSAWLTNGDRIAGTDSDDLNGFYKIIPAHPGINFLSLWQPDDVKDPSTYDLRQHLLQTPVIAWRVGFIGQIIPVVQDEEIRSASKYTATSYPHEYIFSHELETVHSNVDEWIAECRKHWIAELKRKAVA